MKSISGSLVSEFINAWSIEIERELHEEINLWMNGEQRKVDRVFANQKLTARDFCRLYSKVLHGCYWRTMSSNSRNEIAKLASSFSFLAVPEQ